MKPIKNWKASRRVDGKGTPSNQERADCIESVLSHYYASKEGKTEAYDSLNSCLIDLLSDFYHFSASKGIDPDNLVHIAHLNFESER